MELFGLIVLIICMFVIIKEFIKRHNENKKLQTTSDPSRLSIDRSGNIYQTTSGTPVVSGHNMITGQYELYDVTTGNVVYNGERNALITQRDNRKKAGAFAYLSINSRIGHINQSTVNGGLGNVYCYSDNDKPHLKIRKLGIFNIYGRSFYYDCVKNKYIKITEAQKIRDMSGKDDVFIEKSLKYKGVKTLYELDQLLLERANNMNPNKYEDHRFNYLAEEEEMNLLCHKLVSDGEWEKKFRYGGEHE